MNTTPDFHEANNFSVPDGYFESLTSRVMEKIPAQEVRILAVDEKPRRQVGRSAWLKYSTAAAILALMGLAGTMWMTSRVTPRQAQMASITSATYSNDDNLDAVADYIMVDDQDLYAYLSGE